MLLDGKKFITKQYNLNALNPKSKLKNLKQLL